MKMQLSEIARALDIDNINENWEKIHITNVQFDSREVKQGSLFIPITTGIRDGHDFISPAVENGAAAAIWQNNHLVHKHNIPTLMVDDSLLSMQRLAQYFLNKINPKVVAITGSNGKTTTKDMIAKVLSSKFNVYKTPENFNNEIGVPITVLGMESNTEILVVELGMDRPGQISHLSKLVTPDVAVITMIGEAHIEFFKNKIEIAKAKLEILDGLKEDGILVYNGDDPILEELNENINHETKTFGLRDINDIFAKNISSAGLRTLFECESQKFEIPILAKYNVYNALAAIALGKNYNIDLKIISNELKNFKLTKNRTEYLIRKNGGQLISDVYNSNPTAVKEVLKHVNELDVSGRKILVLGDMLELGEHAVEMHRDLSLDILNSNYSDVYLIGPLMRYLYDILIKTYSCEHIHFYNINQIVNLTDDLLSHLRPDDLILLKGSHGIHLEEVVDKLIN